MNLLPKAWTGRGNRLSPSEWLQRFGLHPGGSWSLSWVVLFAGGIVVADLEPTALTHVLASVLAALFAGLTLVGALAFASVPAPIWILPAAVLLGGLRGLLWDVMGPEAAYGLSLLYEPAAALVSAGVVFRADLLRTVPVTRGALAVSLLAVAGLELADGWTGLAGGRPAILDRLWILVAPAAALVELAAMWLWIARRELRIEQAEQAQRVLEDKEAWLFDFFEKAPDMLLILRPESCVIERCNRRFSEALGYARREVVGRALFDFVDPARLRRVRPALQGSEWRRLRNLDLRLLRRDGTPLDVLANFAVRPEAVGGPPELRAVLHDVTRLRRLREEALADDSVERSVLEAAPAGIFQMDAEGHCTWLNPSFSEISGLSAERAREFGLFACLHADDAGAVRAVLRHAVRDQVAVRVRHRVVPRPGVEHWVLTECVPVPGEGEAPCLVGSMMLLDGPGAALDHDAERAVPPRRARRIVPEP